MRVWARSTRSWRPTTSVFIVAPYDSGLVVRGQPAAALQLAHDAQVEDPAGHGVLRVGDVGVVEDDLDALFRRPGIPDVAVQAVGFFRVAAAVLAGALHDRLDGLVGIVARELDALDVGHQEALQEVAVALDLAARAGNVVHGDPDV